MDKAWSEYLAKEARRAKPAYDANAYDALRQAAYAKVFGGPATSVRTLPIPTPPFPVNVEIYDEPPAIDLIVPAPLTGRPRSAPLPRSWTTLVTRGMSNERMAVPPGTPADCCRVELAMYLSHDAVRKNPDLVDFCGDVLLYWSKHPFLTDSYLWPTDAIPVITIGQGQVRFFGDPSMTAFFLSPPPHLFPESALNEHLVLDGDPVRILALVPVTQADVSRIRTFGGDAFYEQSHLSAIYTGPR